MENEIVTAQLNSSWSDIVIGQLYPTRIALQLLISLQANGSLMSHSTQLKVWKVLLSYDNKPGTMAFFSLFECFQVLDCVCNTN